jgi:hypothetical protein
MSRRRKAGALIAALGLAVVMTLTACGASEQPAGCGQQQYDEDDD